MKSESIISWKQALASDFVTKRIKRIKSNNKKQKKNKNKNNKTTKVIILFKTTFSLLKKFKSYHKIVSKQ